MGKGASKAAAEEHTDRSPNLSRDTTLTTDYSSHYSLLSVHSGTLVIAVLLIAAVFIAFLFWRAHSKLRSARRHINILRGGPHDKDSSAIELGPIY